MTADLALMSSTYPIYHVGRSGIDWEKVVPILQKGYRWEVKWVGSWSVPMLAVKMEPGVFSNTSKAIACVGNID
jgi:hypothetical protein